MRHPLSRRALRGTLGALIALALCPLAACSADEGSVNLAVQDEGDAQAVVSFFSPMEKANPDAENTARTASDLTIAMAEERGGLTVAYRTYTAEDYQDKTYDEVCLERVRSDKDDLYLLNTDAIVALGSGGAPGRSLGPSLCPEPAGGGARSQHGGRQARGHPPGGRGLRLVREQGHLR